MDERLVIRARNGDEEAFRLLVETVLDRFHGVARNLLRDRALAEDAVQAALVHVWRDLPRLRDVARFEAWSYRLLVNACHSEGRRQRRWMPGILADDAPEPSVGDGSGAVDTRDQLERGFRRLSMEHRTVVVLCHYLELPMDRVAEILAVPEGTVRSRLYRATQALRAALEADARLATSELPRRAGR